MSKAHLTACLLATTLLAVPAFAQTTTTQPATPPAAGSMTQPATPPAAGSNMGSGTTTTLGAGGSAMPSSNNFITRREPGVFRASELIGMDVRGANNEDIGEVGDVLIDRTGQAQAVVIDVGGFLGIGETHVAIPMDALQFQSQRRNASAAGTVGTANPATTGATGQNDAARTPATQNQAAAAEERPDVVVLVMTKDQLKNAPKFEDDNERAGNAAAPAAGGATSPGTTTPRK